MERDLEREGGREERERWERKCVWVCMCMHVWWNFCATSDSWLCNYYVSNLIGELVSYCKWYVASIILLI